MFLILSTRCQKTFGCNCQLWFPDCGFEFQTVWYQFLSHALTKEVFMQIVSNSFIFKLIQFYSNLFFIFISVDRSCCEQCVVSLSSYPTSLDVEACSTSIVRVTSSCFLFGGFHLFPPSLSLVFEIKNIVEGVHLVSPDNITYVAQYIMGETLVKTI